MDLPDEHRNTEDIGQMVLNSLNFMKHSNGSSVADIKKHLKSIYDIDVDRSVSKDIQQYLRKATENNILTEINGRYMVADTKGVKRQQTLQCNVPVAKRAKIVVERNTRSLRPRKKDSETVTNRQAGIHTLPSISGCVMNGATEHTNSLTFQNSHFPVIDMTESLSLDHESDSHESSENGHRSVLLSRNLLPTPQSTVTTKRSHLMKTRSSNAGRRNTTPKSPDYAKLVKQMEDDESLARSLQAQFDAEARPQGLPNGGPSTRVAARTLPTTLEQTSINLARSLQCLYDAEIARREAEACALRNTPASGAVYGGSDFNRHVHEQASSGIADFVSASSGRQASVSTNAERPDLHESLNFINRTNSTNRNRHNYQIAIGGRYFEFGTALNAFTVLMGLPSQLPSQLGLSKSEIGRLPTHTYYKNFHSSTGSSTNFSKGPVSSEIQMDRECQICLSKYEEGDNLRTLPCFHEFHNACIDKWLKINRTCPNCRVAVVVTGDHS